MLSPFSAEPREYSSGDISMWNENPPKFYFISLATPPSYRGVIAMQRDELACSTPAVNLLRQNNFAFVKQVERSIGCVVNITPQNYPKEDPREIGFVGTDESIKAAYMTIWKKLKDHRSDRIYVHRVKDAWEPKMEEIRFPFVGEL
jgi:hypothetical protein